MSFFRSLSNLAQLLMNKHTPPSREFEPIQDPEKNHGEVATTQSKNIITPMDRAHYNVLHPYHPLRLNPVNSTPSIRPVTPPMNISDLSAVRFREGPKVGG